MGNVYCVYNMQCYECEFPFANAIFQYKISNTVSITEEKTI